MAQIPSYPSLAAVSDSDKFVAAVGTANKVYHVLGSTLKTYVNTSQLLYVDTTQVGTTAVTTEETLATYTLPANTLTVDGDYIEITASGSFAANGNNKRVRVKFGATTILDSGGAAPNEYTWSISCKVFRTAAATQKATSKIESVAVSLGGLTASVLNYAQITTPAETLTSTVAIALTGQNGTANANDIVIETFTIEHKKQ